MFPPEIRRKIVGDNMKELQEAFEIFTERF